MDSQLTVYKASAGSGKTFTLAREYMTLVIANPQSYRTILAVTFTNKATEEMKTRILSQLYGIAHGLRESRGYLEQIQKSLPHLSQKQIEKNAATALSLLIHNYNYFRVETIDTFFQSVLRNLARELDLTANLRISLNDFQVEQQAVDQLIENLGPTDRLLFWIMDYIKSKIADDKSWNVIGEIKSFGENIFRDYYKSAAKSLNEVMEQEDFFKNFTAKLRKIKQDAKEHFSQIAATFFGALEENGLSVSDFSYGATGVCGYFIKFRDGRFDDEKLVGKRVLAAMEDERAWMSAADAKPGSPKYELVCGTLAPLLRYSEEKRPQLLKLYKSADLTLRNLSQLRLLGSIEKEVRALNEEANRFLLSDTQTLLHSLMQDSDSPFIFEKIGTQLEHVMIDEFQDTSTIQWQNFKVLLDETMSHQDSGNLIVGDVKQSIYRWRSGDWRLLNNIQDQFDAKRLDIKTLDTNYRSERNIIDFNNAFFTQAAESEYQTLKENTPEEAEQLRMAYSDVVQKVPSGKPATGFVQVKLLNKDEWKERTLKETLETITQLIELGAKPSQIAILVRTNRTIKDVAEYLMNNKCPCPLVSDEAFRLDASQAVNSLVTALRVLAHPDDPISRATLQKFALNFIGSDEIVEKIERQRDALLQKPIFDLVEHLFVELQLDTIEEMKSQSAYICAFYDQLAAYLQDNSCDIDSFIKEWDNTLHEKSIRSDVLNGIRLVTIHKSKGLEFDYVIIPFCDWLLETSKGTLWCTPTEAPFDEIPLVPVDFIAKQMKGSIYENDYHHEHLQNMVDNMNLLYVAFTRASRGLFVIAHRGKESFRSCLIEKVLPDVEKALGSSDVPVLLSNFSNDDIFFEYGTLSVEEAETVDKKKKPSENVFCQQAANVSVQLKVNPAMPQFRQSNKSRDFIQGDEDEEQQKYYIKLGTILHSLFSTIRTTDDIEQALRQLELDGMLYDENLSRQRLETMIRKRLQSQRVAHWFSSHWTLFNECSILSVEDGKVVEHRPDRVMKDERKTIVVDFKFGKPKDEHHEQVRQYMRLLEGMEADEIENNGNEDGSCTQVEGYLWYVYPNKIVKVEP